MIGLARGLFFIANDGPDFGKLMLLQQYSARRHQQLNHPVHKRIGCRLLIFGASAGIIASYMRSRH